MRVYSQTKTNGEAPIGEAPVLVKIDGIPFWKSSGRTFPVVAGAEDPPGDGKTEGDSDTGNAPGGAKEGDEFDKDRALATIRTQREKEERLLAELKELRPLKARLQEREDADKTEVERLTTRVTELTAALTDTQGTLRTLRVDRAVEDAARANQARNPAAVSRLIDRSALKLDDDGVPTNADDLVKALVKSDAYLFGKDEPPPARGNGTGPKPTGDGQALTEQERRKQAVGIRNYW